MEFLDFAGFLVIVVAAVTSIGLNILFLEQKKETRREESRRVLDPSSVGYYPGGTRGSFQLSPRSPLVVFFGDTRAQDWAAPMTTPDAQFVNRGIQRQTVAQVEGRILPHIALLHPEAVVLQAGIHDLLNIPFLPGGEDEIVEGCIAGLARTADELIAQRCPVILTTVIPLCAVPGERRPAWAESVTFAAHRVNAELLRMAKPGLVVFDTAALVCGADGHVLPEYCRDIVRLNGAAYDRLNGALADLLDRVIRQRPLRAGSERRSVGEQPAAAAR